MVTFPELSRIKYATMDREPVYGRGITWTKGKCSDCGRCRPIVVVDEVSTEKCGYCHMAGRNERNTGNGERK